MPNVTQIAATELTSGADFNCYIKPEVPDTGTTQQITGISLSSGQLTEHGMSVESCSITFAVYKLGQLENSILVVHI